jgi:threonine synthase
VILRHLLRGDLEPAVVDGIIDDALDFPIPLVRLTDRIYVLELFHGPTAAFKDVAARVMARLMVRLRVDPREELTVLTATSGDTGGAVADAFFGVPGTRVVVLYPKGRVSRLQERQFTTLGGNVLAVAINGSFDDCQHLARQALTDRRLQAALRLTSANSINVGRLLPQITYYGHAWAQLPRESHEIVVSVPSGNFGNITAGLMAKRLGIPISLFVAATNANDVFPTYLATGDFRPLPAVHTISSAMDVGNPSNVARLAALYEGDLDRVRRDVVARSCTDAETRECIRDVHARYGYVLDPHSAVGYLALAEELVSRPEAVGVCLATAHPAKFADVVEPVIGRAVPLPDALATRLGGTPRSMSLEPDITALAELLLSWGGEPT